MENKQLIPFTKELWKSGKYGVLNQDDNDVHVFQIFEGIVFYRYLFGEDIWLPGSISLENCNLKMYDKFPQYNW